MPPVVVEVCVDSVQSAIKLSTRAAFIYTYVHADRWFISAVNAGADRLEVCGNLGIGGGTTPSVGLLKLIQKAAKGVPIMVGEFSTD